jgi:osmotically-inducible protein OsmY
MKTDKDLISQIKEKLSAQPALKDCLSTIALIVNDGDVLVSGQVDTAEQHKLIVQTIDALPGIRVVTDNLKVQKGSRHRHNVDIDWSKGEMDVE